MISPWEGNMIGKPPAETAPSFCAEIAGGTAADETSGTAFLDMFQ
jgi:hypothetical protein